MEKQLRIDFPDYSAHNQERDAQRHKEQQKKDVYIVKVRGTYGAYLPDGDDNISYNNFQAKNLKDFYTAAKRFYKKMKIEPKFHCVLNQGIEDYIQQNIVIQNLVKER